ncbi:MAG: TraR/DksA family transcriptional regulator [Spirochaetales bacterium]|nr:TraR/DksA family transcriptional regulator [Spirochaetales bacterium]
MEQQFVNEMEKRLKELKASILDLLAKENEAFSDILNDNGPKDSVDVASGDIDKQLLSVIGKNDLSRLKKIESALSRIKNERYGKCLDCGKKISVERLEAIPYAFFCISCESKRDKRR